MSLIRFETTAERGPSGKLWGNLVDWVKGTLKIDSGVADIDDFAPLNEGNFVKSTDSGTAVSELAASFGVASFTASAGTYAVAGYSRRFNVDLDNSRDVCREVRCARTTGATGTEQTLIGFSDQLTGAVFHSDGTLDGGSNEDTLGLLWNNDLTVDLVSVIDSATTVVLIEEVATAIAQGVGVYHKFGLRIKKISSTQFQIIASVDGVTKKVVTTSVSLALMKPVVATVISATDAPVIDVDWDCTVDVAN